MPEPLPLGVLAALATAEPGASTMAIARAFGLEHRYRTLVAARWAMRRAGGWYCRLSLVPCTECGAPGAGPKHATAHRHCRAAREQRYARERARRDPGRSARSMREWRRAHPDRARASEERSKARARARRAALPAEQVAELRAGARERNRRYQERSLGLAEHYRTPWTSDEDAYLIEHWHDRRLDVALALGRTVYGVKDRRAALRARLTRRRRRAG